MIIVQNKAICSIEENTMGQENKLSRIPFVKIILMLVVMLGHACAFWSGHWFTENPIYHSNVVATLYFWVSSFHIYAFTLVSGYVFAFKVHEGGYNSYILFLRNKAKRLLVPYFFVMLFWVAPISAYYFNWGWSYLFKKYILCMDPSQLWFLWMLFGVFAIVWPFRKIMMDKPFVGWGISAIFYSVGMIGKRLLPNVFCVWTACQYVFFFFIGVRIKTKEENGEVRITEIIPWYIWLVGDLFVFAGMMFVTRKSEMIWSLMNIGMKFILHICGAVMAWTTLQMLAAYFKWEDRKVFRILSSYLMPMYLFHQQIIYFSIVWLNGKVNPWINTGVNFIIAFIGSFLISTVLMRWKMTRFLIGER